MDPRRAYDRAMGWAGEALDNATVTVGGLPEVRTPRSVKIGNGGVSASFTDNGYLILAAVAAVLLFVHFKGGK